jgi:hypothetical protein
VRDLIAIASGISGVVGGLAGFAALALYARARGRQPRPTTTRKDRP